VCCGFDEALCASYPVRRLYEDSQKMRVEPLSDVDASLIKTRTRCTLRSRSRRSRCFARARKLVAPETAQDQLLQALSRRKEAPLIQIKEKS
jgi:hypothetical protein